MWTHSIPARALCLCLSLLLSGVPTAFAQNAEPHRPSLDARIAIELRRTHSPGTPGTPAGATSDQDLSEIEGDLITLKNDTEAKLAAGTDTGRLLPAYFAQTVNQYLNRLTQYITLRISLSLPHDRKWREPYRLAIPEAYAEDIPTLETLAKGRLGNFFYPLNIENGFIDLSESLIQGLELGAVERRPNDAGFLKLIRYLAVQQLLSNLSSLSRLQGQPDSIPNLPDALKADFATFGDSETLTREREKARITPLFIEILGRRAKELRVPRFATLALARKILPIVAPNAKLEQAEGPFQRVLEESEGEVFGEALDTELWLSGMDPTRDPNHELARKLGKSIALGKESTALNKILQLTSAQVFDIPQANRSKLTEETTAAQEAYFLSLPSSLLNETVQAALAETHDQLTRQARIQLTEALLAASPEAAETFSAFDKGERIHLAVFLATKGQQLAGLKLREHVQKELDQVLANAASYGEARLAFNQALVRKTTPLIIVDGYVDLGLVERWISRHDFGKNIALSKPLKDKIIESRKNDIQDFVKVGQLLGFHLPRLGENPKVSEVLRSEKEQTPYFKALRRHTLNRFPLLAIEVRGKTLAENLAELSRDPGTPEGAFHEVVGIALAKAEKATLENLVKVAETESLQEIEAVVTSSVMLQLVFEDFKSFKKQQMAYVQAILDPALFEQVMSRYVGKYLMGGFTTLIILQGAGWLLKRSLGPWISALLSAFNPIVHGFIRSATALIVVDTIHQIHETHKIREKAEESESLFESGPFPIVTYDEASGARSEATSATWWLFGRIAMDSLLMYRPMIKEWVKSGIAPKRSNGRVTLNANEYRLARSLREAR